LTVAPFAVEDALPDHAGDHLAELGLPQLRTNVRYHRFRSLYFRSGRLSG
jgi:hypothetical protein